MKLVIATRRSPLALWQAGYVKRRLQERHAGLQVELLPMSTRGDELLHARLDQAGGKGLFVKELENALADGRAQLAVHSMKDVPADLPEGFVIAAILAREDPRDAFVSNLYPDLASMPAAGLVGTSSLRRAAQIKERHARLEVKLLRGNVETRLSKLDQAEFHAIILAVAGLVRLGLEQRIRSRLDIDDSLPAPGQGALGIECLAREREVLALVGALADAAATACVRAERAVSRALGGSCALPLGAYAEVDGDGLQLRALVASADGGRVLRARVAGPSADPEALGRQAAAELRARGAIEVLGA